MKEIRAIAVALSLTGLSAAAAAAPVVFSDVGNAPADIVDTVNAFRTALGTLNPNVAGSFGSGRREINWDGVPDGFSAPNALPANFFNVNSPRGVLFSTPGSGFQVSADSANPTSTPILFNNLLPPGGGNGGSENFQVFTAERLFTAIGSPITDVSFLVAGSNTPALTRGFGVVFTDVDDGTNSNTGVQFFDVNGALLDSFLAPSNTSNQNLSFLGVDYGANIVSRVRITSGRCALDPNNPGPCEVDVVVMDDFIYGEPVAAAAAVPAPAALALLGTALLGLAGLRRRA